MLVLNALNSLEADSFSNHLACSSSTTQPTHLQACHHHTPIINNVLHHKEQNLAVLQGAAHGQQLANCLTVEIIAHTIRSSCSSSCEAGILLPTMMFSYLVIWKQNSYTSKLCLQ